MKTSGETVAEFLRLTNDEGNIKAAVQLMADDIKFTGPAAQVSGSNEYHALLEQFLPVHSGWKKLAEFENGDNVCVVDDVFVKTPAGDTITLSMSEWFKVTDGKIKEHKVFYDPREFTKAFGMD